MHYLLAIESGHVQSLFPESDTKTIDLAVVERPLPNLATTRKRCVEVAGNQVLIPLNIRDRNP